MELSGTGVGDGQGQRGHLLPADETKVQAARLHGQPGQQYSHVRGHGPLLPIAPDQDSPFFQPLSTLGEQGCIEDHAHGDKVTRRADQFARLNREPGNASHDLPLPGQRAPVAHGQGQLDLLFDQNSSKVEGRWLDHQFSGQHLHRRR